MVAWSPYTEKKTSRSVSRILYAKRDDHPSAIVVTNNLMQPTCRLMPGRHLLRPCGPLGLAPSGVYLANCVATITGELLPHRFTLT